MSACRCGHDGDGPHPCHGEGYTCRKSATRRLYNLRPVALSGMQAKLGADETWACDECWQKFQDRIAAAKAKESA